MHDLIGDVGKEIVRQESPNEPGKRSRLWFYKDILHVLKQNTGTNEVEVIFLDLPEHLLEGNGAQIQWSGKAFMKMKNLKILVIKNAYFSRCPAYLPNSLRCLKWKGYPFKFWPYMSCLTELIYLDLSCSHFDTIHPFIEKFHNLSRMNFRNCKFLQQIPDLSGVSNLRVLWLDGCTNLVEIHHSVGCLYKLKELSAMRCYNLEILPPRLSLTSLEQLNLFGCSSLYSFPDIVVEMKCVRTLDLGRTAIITLPSSICNLIELETLNMEECPYLEQLPTTICLLPFLWSLNANFSKVMTRFKMCEGGEENLGCYALSSKLEHFCFSKCNLSYDSLALCLSYFTNTIHLDLSYNNFTNLPACIKECRHLRYLLLDKCKYLQHIEDMPPNLEKFSAIYCISLTKLSENKILYQALNLQPGKRNFILPGGKFPENLHNYSTGSYVSFWIRDVLPTIFLWILVKHDQDFLSNCTFLVHVNGTKLDITSEWLLLSTMKIGHLYIWDLQSMIHKAELPQGYRWNHVKVSIKSNTSGRDQFHFALHVYKQQNNPKTIRFMDPKKIYANSNLWQIVQQPQGCKELEDDMLCQDLAPRVINLKAQLSPKEEDLKAKGMVSPSRWTYNVLLSYGGDYEYASLVSRLYNSMCQLGIPCLVNDELVKTSGEELKGINESMIVIIVISKTYASSPSCLDSLATFLECFRMKYQFIRLKFIFYGVEPLELQHQTGSFEEVFDRFEKIFKHNKKQVQKWRLALSDAVDISSGRLIRNAAEDGDAIRSILVEVFSMVDRFPASLWNDSEIDKSRMGSDPGFFPTDEEIVAFYLYNKLQGRSDYFNRVIPDIGIYDFEPFQLPMLAREVSHGDTQQWFFFLPRQEREARGGGPNRSTAFGYWKATGPPCYICSSNNKVIGLKENMVYYRGEAPFGRKTKWKMDEYRVIEFSHQPSLSIPKLRHEFSLCRVYVRAFDQRPLTSSIPVALMVSFSKGEQCYPKRKTEDTVNSETQVEGKKVPRFKHQRGSYGEQLA